TLERFHADDGRPVTENESGDRALDGRHPGLRFDERANRAAIETAIALSPRRPNRRPLAAIEHSELDRGEIRCSPHDPAQRIDLANDRAFGDSADRGIAGHLPD